MTNPEHMVAKAQGELFLAWRYHAVFCMGMADFDPQARRDVSQPELTAAQARTDDDDVAEAMAGLSGLVSSIDDLDEVLAQIAGFAVTAVRGADGAGVTLVRADGERNPVSVVAWAVTEPFVRELDHLQYEVCDEGPCLTAMRTGRALTSGSLGSDDRWRRFGGRAARLGVHSALSVPLLSRGGVVGALNIYARVRDVFTDHAVLLAEQFAAPAAVSVANIQLLHAALERATQLQAALVNRAVIDQAIGIVRSRSGSNAEEAFDRLRQISQTEKVKLAVVAQRLVDEAVRRAHARSSQSE